MRQLHRLYKSATIFPGKFVPSIPFTPRSAPSLVPSANILDTVTIAKATQVLSQEMELPQLLSKFVNIIGENVGAELGAILLLDGDKLV